MKRFKVTFEDVFENCESEEQAYNALLEYLSQCVKFEDVTGFGFEELPEKCSSSQQTAIRA